MKENKCLKDSQWFWCHGYLIFRLVTFSVHTSKTYHHDKRCLTSVTNANRWCHQWSRFNTCSVVWPFKKFKRKTLNCLSTTFSFSFVNKLKKLNLFSSPTSDWPMISCPLVHTFMKKYLEDQIFNYPRKHRLKRVWELFGVLQHYQEGSAYKLEVGVLCRISKYTHIFGIQREEVRSCIRNDILQL